MHERGFTIGRLRGACNCLDKMDTLGLFWPFLHASMLAIVAQSNPCRTHFPNVLPLRTKLSLCTKFEWVYLSSGFAFAESKYATNRAQRCNVLENFSKNIAKFNANVCIPTSTAIAHAQLNPTSRPRAPNPGHQGRGVKKFSPQLGIGKGNPTQLLANNGQQEDRTILHHIINMHTQGVPNRPCQGLSARV